MKFKDAKVGDKVWGIIGRWGIIEQIDDCSTYPLKVVFDNGQRGSFTLDGKNVIKDSMPSLFWNEQDLSNDPPPKRKKKVLLRQAVMKNGDTIFITSNFYKNEEELYRTIYGNNYKFIRWGVESIEIEVDE